MGRVFFLFLLFFFPWLQAFKVILSKHQLTTKQTELQWLHTTERTDLETYFRKSLSKQPTTATTNTGERRIWCPELPHDNIQNVQSPTKSYETCKETRNMAHLRRKKIMFKFWYICLDDLLPLFCPPAYILFSFSFYTDVLSYKSIKLLLEADTI